VVTLRHYRLLSRRPRLGWRQRNVRKYRLPVVSLAPFTRLLDSNLLFHSQVSKVELDASKILVNPEKQDESTKEGRQYNEMMPWTQEDCKSRMEEINVLVKEVSRLHSRDLGHSLDIGPDTTFFVMFLDAD